MENKPRQELVFGLVGPLGVNLDQIYDSLSQSLQRVGYESEKIVISDLFSQVSGLKNPIKDDTEYDRIESRMNRGDELRNKMGGDSTAILAIHQMQKSRENKTNSITKPFHDHAYVLKSLKHISEVQTLREIYGKSFWLISAFVSREQRMKILSEKIGSHADKLISRDYYDSMEILGQAVREIFPEADMFVDASDSQSIEKQFNRFIELIFGNTFHTPYREEHGMFHAFASSLRSSSMSRQVGAAILDNDGSLISTGTNEVPKAGGGIYWAGDEPDFREFVQGHDSNQQEKLDMLQDIFSRLKKSGWLSDKYREKENSELVDTALESAELKDIKVMDLTEYGREVHAEMDALVGASRRNESVKDCIMYCTTFPCHICAKHIVSSGIKKLVFVEPYPKSHADKLFQDSISVGDKETGKVHFKPYFGISPRRYIDMFKMRKRKDKKTGKKIDWNPSNSNPIFQESLEVTNLESAAVMGLIERMEQKDMYVK